MKSPSFTIGIEEEYQIIDLTTRELTSYVTRILEEGRSFLHERMKPQMHQSQIERRDCSTSLTTWWTSWGRAARSSMR